jgi:hypothetical protein
MASARIALMTSPWLTTAYTASSPSAAFHSRTADTDRACIPAIDSPSAPGNTAALGCVWTTFHIGSFVRVLRAAPVHSP